MNIFYEIYYLIYFVIDFIWSNLILLYFLFQYENEILTLKRMLDNLQIELKEKNHGQQTSSSASNNSSPVSSAASSNSPPSPAPTSPPVPIKHSTASSTTSSSSSGGHLYHHHSPPLQSNIMNQHHQSSIPPCNSLSSPVHPSLLQKQLTQSAPVTSRRDYSEPTQTAVGVTSPADGEQQNKELQDLLTK